MKVRAVEGETGKARESPLLGLPKDLASSGGEWKPLKISEHKYNLIQILTRCSLGC